MSTDDLAELQALRARAYGPAADIADDAAALERLNELERAARRAEHPEPQLDPESAEPDPGAVLLAEFAAEAPEPDADSAVEPEPPRTRRRRWPWVAAGWAVSLVLACVATAWLTARAPLVPLEVGAAAPQIASLRADPEGEVPGFFGPGGDAVVYEDFFGLRVVSGVDWGSPTGECLIVFDPERLIETSGGWSYEAQIFNGCAAGPFPATVEVTNALDDAPAALVEAFGDDLALQFVLDGDTVAVLQG